MKASVGVRFTVEYPSRDYEWERFAWTIEVESLDHGHCREAEVLIRNGKVGGERDVMSLDAEGEAVLEHFQDWFLKSVLPTLNSSRGGMFAV